MQQPTDPKDSSADAPSTAEPAQPGSYGPAASRAGTPLWLNLSFQLMWTSTAASGFGDRIIMMAGFILLGGLIDRSQSTSIHAATQFWFFLPYILFSIPAGWLADRLPRKWLMLSCDEIRGLILLLATALLIKTQGSAVLDEQEHWRVFAIISAVGAFAGVFNPARNAIVPQIVERNHLQAANAVILGINIVASLIGMVLADVIMDPDEAQSVGTGLGIAAGMYLISGLFFAFLKPRESVAAPTQAQRRSRSFREGLLYAIQHKRVLGLIGLNILVWSSAAVVSSSVAGLGDQLFGMQGAALFTHYSRMGATLGAGMLLGAIAVMALKTRRESPLILLVAVVLAGLSVLIFVAVPVLAIHYVAGFSIGFFGNITIVTVISLLQSICPNHIRGRVMGINAVANTTFSTLTYFSLWQLPAADQNIIPVLYALGALLLGVAMFGLLPGVMRGPMAMPSLNLFWRIVRLYTFVWHRLRYYGHYNVPREGPVVLAANHTTGLDPFVMQAAIPRCVRWLMLTEYLFRVLNFFWKRVKPIALDKNSSDAAKLRQLVGALRENEIIGIFPEGTLQRGHRELRKLEPGVAVIAKRGRAQIVPVWIDGTPRVRHMFWHFATPSHTTVLYGEPFIPDKNADNDAVMQELRDRMLGLAQRLKELREQEPGRGESEVAEVLRQSPRDNAAAKDEPGPGERPKIRPRIGGHPSPSQPRESETDRQDPQS